MKNKAKLRSLLRKSIVLIAAAITVLSLFALAGCGDASDKETGGSSISSVEQKTVIFKIVFEDGSEKTVELKTEKNTLAQALVDANIIEYSADGFYTTIDGVTADYNKDGAWWCITKGGEMLNHGLNDLTISDGETYEATYTK